MGDFLFVNNDDRNIGQKEIDKIGNEILSLLEMLGGDSVNNNNNNKYIGYKLAEGDEFGLIIYDNPGDDESIVPGHQIIDILLENIREQCQVTVSIGYSKLSVDDGEMADGCEERINNYLKIAKTNGKNQAYWGQKSETKKTSTTGTTGTTRCIC